MKNLTGLILNLGLVASLIVWIYGNSKEQMDMSNAGYQVFGFLGTVGFGVLTAIYFLTLFIKGRRNKKTL